jgi:hypothetical protein
MSASYEIYKVWTNHDGKVVTINQKKFRLKVSTYEATYPYSRHVIEVKADPINKKSKWYQDDKNLLGDDWFLDVLECSCELQADILTQC